MTDQSPAPGWYPAPHANNEQRYWDGGQWLESGPTAATLVQDVPTSASATPAPASQPKKPAGLAIAALVVGIVAFLTGIVPVVGAVLGAAAVTLGIFALVKRQSKGLGITGIALGAVAIISSIAVTAGISANLPSSKPAPVETSQTDTAAEEVEEPAAVMVTVPNVTGMTATDAAAALTAAGLVIANSPEDPLAKVLSTSPAANTEAEEGSLVSLTVEEKPALSLAQQNAIAKAKSYLSMMGFSRTGLIQQLEFEGFPTEDATFGADNAGADWNAECAEKAKSYLDMMAFSRDGLAEQLAFEGFQQTEIDYGLAAVGY